MPTIESTSVAPRQRPKSSAVNSNPALGLPIQTSIAPVPRKRPAGPNPSLPVGTPQPSVSAATSQPPVTAPSPMTPVPQTLIQLQPPTPQGHGPPAPAASQAAGQPYVQQQFAQQGQQQPQSAQQQQVKFMSSYTWL